MKIQTKIAFVLLIIGSLALITSCENNEKNQNNGKITISMTDAADSLAAVLVDIQSVDVHYTKSDTANSDTTNTMNNDSINGWVTLNTNAGVYNLTELQDSVEKVIATGELPAGHVTQIRLILGNDNSAVMVGDTLSLNVPSARNTGLKINYDNDIVPGKQLNVLLDFNLKESVITKGIGEAILKPVIKVKSSSYE